MRAQTPRLAVQADGKILLGGGFTLVNGQQRTGIARLNADGTLESTSTFNPDSAANSFVVHCLSMQSDGRILIGGYFFTARLHADGTLDTGFNPGATPPNDGLSFVDCLAVQVDGKILIGGRFSAVDGQPRNGVARLNPNGTLESAATFNVGTGISGSSRWIHSLALQADGKILLGGEFTSVNGTGRNRIARLLNDAVFQTLTVPDDTRVLWTRGGSAPEVEQVTIDLSTNNGGTWAPLGPAARIPGGWEVRGLNLPAARSLRARGRTTSGVYNGSSGIVEQTLNVSEITVFGSSGADVADGLGSTNSDPVPSGTSSSKEFTIRNVGSGNLTGLAVTFAAGSDIGDFSIGPLGSATLAPGATSTFTVSFSPTAAGTRSATLQIGSNDADGNPFEINLTGIRATASEAWRQTYFGSPYNTGAGADLNDPDKDGIVNLLEFATATDPLASTAFPGKLVKNGNVLEFTYTRRKTALAEMTFVREFSETLNGIWSIVGSTVETILSDDGSLQQVKTTVPAGSAGRRFVRLRVTRL